MELKQDIHIEGNATIINHVTPPQERTSAEKEWQGVLLAAFAAFCGLGLLAWFTVHVLAMIGAFVASNAVELLIGTVTIAAATGGIYYKLTRKPRHETATLPAKPGLVDLLLAYRRKPGAEPAAVRAEAAAPALSEGQPFVYRHVPNREIEDVAFVETPIVYHRGAADAHSRGGAASNHAAL